MSTGQHRTEASEEYRAALLQESSPGVVARILRLDSLLRIKAEAGRGKDLADINELNLLHGRKSSYDK